MERIEEVMTAPGCERGFPWRPREGSEGGSRGRNLGAIRHVSIVRRSCAFALSRFLYEVSNRDSSPPSMDVSSNLPTQLSFACQLNSFIRSPNSIIRTLGTGRCLPSDYEGITRDQGGGLQPNVPAAPTNRHGTGIHGLDGQRCRRRSRRRATEFTNR